MTVLEPQPDRSPLIVMVFDAVTAQRAAAVLGALAPLTRPVPVFKEDDWSTFETALAGIGPARAVVALIRPSTLQGWVRLAGTRVSLACVEPSLFLLADLLGEIHGLDQHAIRRRKAAFAQVGCEPLAVRLSMEVLFFRPTETGLHLGMRRDGWPAGPTDVSADPEGYKAAVAALVAAVEDDRLPFFALGQRYAVSRTGLGRVVLGRGWSHPEKGFTWSDGFAATLTLMAPEAVAGPLRVIFRGHVIDDRIAITTFIRGVRVAITTAKAFRAVEIDVPVAFGPMAGDTAVEVRFAFNAVDIPAQRGWSPDGRSLAFALVSFEFVVEGAWREPLDPDSFARLAGETPSTRRGIARARVPHSDREPPPHAVLRRLLDRRPGRIVVVLIEESAIDEPSWDDAVRALAAEALVLATRGAARLFFACAPGEVLQVEDGLETVLAILVDHGIRPDLLFWCSGATAPAFDALWDRLQADGGRPAVLVRTPDVEHVRWLLRSRHRHDVMVSTADDLILFDPVDRVAEL